ncbi:hypothetical protein [Nocardia sp. NPDC050412]|uniref:hypothetical protein n=1 Tax=Nocardia sp. NPDC050412 TaxID=3364320 RepID=UPI0037B85D02
MSRKRLHPVTGVRRGGWLNDRSVVVTSHGDGFWRKQCDQLGRSCSPAWGAWAESASQVQLRPAEALALEGLSLIDGAVSWTVAPRQHQSDRHGREVVLEAGDERV